MSRRLGLVPRLRRLRIERASRSAARAASDPPSSLPLPPVFVGGTGRSGTSVLGRLLGRHPSLFEVPLEVKFITEPGGLTDLLNGRTTLDAFERQVTTGRWWERRGDRGLHALTDREALDEALHTLRADFRRHPWRASAAFTHQLLDPLAAAAGASAWVETTPANVVRGPMLQRLFPGMHLIHSVRDGRDVACSVVARSWGPDDHVEALVWWGNKLERAFAATASMPAESLRVIQLEDLVIRHRDEQYAALLAFLGLDDDPAMRAYFDEQMAPHRAHAGRWEQNVPEERAAAFVAQYEQLAAGLSARGWPYHP